MKIRFATLAFAFLALAAFAAAAQSKFVTVRGGEFRRAAKPYFFIGTNYWYGTLLGLEKDPRRGVGRLRRELDFLKANGVTNLRILAGAEGAGQINGVTRVGPALQTEQEKFDESVLEGLDIILAEMGKRDMTAVVFLSNNWEWSGGFQQYLIWNGLVEGDKKTRKLTWDEQRDIVSKFYSCAPCKRAYAAQLTLVVGRTNKVTGRKYADDPAIMAWELANEPRPMRPFAEKDYAQWISDTAAAIKKIAPKQLVTIGHEGFMGTENMELFERVHADKNVDYVTIHVWAKNWGWFTGEDVAGGFPNVMAKASAYVADHLKIARKLGKPLVIEEFGLPRDGHSFDPSAPTTLRDKYYAMMLGYVGRKGGVAGANFWAFGGTARPVAGQVFWKKGDDYMGDPPMEEQGLNTVFDGDASTWNVIRKAGK